MSDNDPQPAHSVPSQNGAPEASLTGSADGSVAPADAAPVNATPVSAARRYRGLLIGGATAIALGIGACGVGVGFGLSQLSSSSTSQATGGSSGGG